MNYQLVTMIFTKEMGRIPIRLVTNIPENLARALMNTHVISARFAIAEGISSVSVPLVDYKTESIILPERITKGPGGHITIDKKDGG